MNRFMRLLAIFAVAVLVPAVPFLLVGELPGDKWLAMSEGGGLLFGLSGAALLAADTFLPIPSSLLGSLIGARLGLISGWFWINSGLVTGNVVGYGLGRLWPNRKKESLLDKKPTLLVVAISRPVPVLAEAVAITAGAGAMPLRLFLVGSVIGNSIYSLILASNGSILSPTSFRSWLIVPLAIPAIGWCIWQLSKRFQRAT